MTDIPFHVSFWAPTALYALAWWLVISIPKLPGKHWLTGFLITRVVAASFTYVTQLLQRVDLLGPDAYRDLVLSGAPGVVNLVGYGLLVGFALALTPLASDNRGISNLLFSFQGRLRRQPFWIVSLTLGAMNSSMFLGILDPVESSPSAAQLTVYIAVFLLWVPLLIWMSLAIQVKRWHDRDKSGWWILIGLIPIVGGIWALVEAGFMKGTPGPNRFDLAVTPERAVARGHGTETA